jgi:hypothetical protein
MQSAIGNPPSAIHTQDVLARIAAAQRSLDELRADVHGGHFPERAVSLRQIDRVAQTLDAAAGAIRDQRIQLDSMGCCPIDQKSAIRNRR